MSTVMITGVTGGFGHLMAEELIKGKHKVIGTARDVKGRNASAAGELRKLGVSVFEMDVTDDGSVNGAVEAILGEAGSLDVVVNNAGIGVLGLTETFTPEDMRKLFDVNVIGVHRVNRAVLPSMRKGGKGLLIQISSLLGRITVPFYGPYNATKWAVEALAENYRTELSQTGVEVCIVEPGGYPTTFINNLVRPGDAGRGASYGELGQMAEGFLKGFEQALAANPAQDPRNVGKAIAELVGMPRGKRPFRTIVDKMGMGTHIEGYNSMLGQITKGIYGAFGIGHLLELK